MNLIEKHISRAQQLLELSRYKECIAETKKALALDPIHREALSLLVHATALGSHPEETESIGMEALQHHAEESSIYFGLGLARMKLGYYTQAEAYFKIALKYRPYQAASYINLAICLKAQNKWEKAKIAIEKALEFNPDDDLALNIKAQIERKKQSNQYEKSLDEAMRIAPDKGYHHEIKARYCFEKKDFVQSAFHYQEAVRLSPLDTLLRNEFLRTLVRTHPTFQYSTKYYPFADGNIWQRMTGLLLLVLATLFLKAAGLFSLVTLLLWLPLFMVAMMYWFGMPFARTRLAEKYFKQKNHAIANYLLPLQTLSQLTLLGLLGLLFTNLDPFKAWSICTIFTAYLCAFMIHQGREELVEWHKESPWVATAVWSALALLIPFLLFFQEKEVLTEGVL